MFLALGMFLHVYIKCTLETVYKDAIKQFCSPEAVRTDRCTPKLSRLEKKMV